MVNFLTFEAAEQPAWPAANQSRPISWGSRRAWGPAAAACASSSSSEWPWQQDSQPARPARNTTGGRTTHFLPARSSCCCCCCCCCCSGARAPASGATARPPPRRKPAAPFGCGQLASRQQCPPTPALPVAADKGARSSVLSGANSAKTPSAGRTVAPRSRPAAGRLESSRVELSRAEPSRLGRGQSKTGKVNEPDEGQFVVIICRLFSGAS